MFSNKSDTIFMMIKNRIATKIYARNVFRWLGRIILLIFIFLLGMLAFGLVREAITRHKYRAQYPPPGEMITINDDKIHLNCVGSGSPTVVFESDLDQYGSQSWNYVQKDISKLTRACSYDRAGIMWSEPGPRPRNGEIIAAELRAVLEKAGEKGPYLMVGHAFGGAYIRIFAGQNPDDVCGMVLVESSHPEMLTRMAEYGVVPEIPDKKIRPLILLLSHLGIPNRDQAEVYGSPPEIADPLRAYLPKSSMAWFDEKVESHNTLAQAAQYESLGDLPLIVLAASGAPTSVDQGQQLQDIWLELQHELLSLSTDSEIRVYETGHYPQLQSPELVIEAIQDVFGKCKEFLQ
jgi:pimeloyl-ACP methyl ester carboxylesterase